MVKIKDRLITNQISIFEEKFVMQKYR